MNDDWKEKMNNNNRDLAVFNEIKWYRLVITFLGKKNSSIMKSHPISVIQAIVKAVSSKTPGFASLESEDMPLFHLIDKKHTFKMKSRDQIPVEFLFFKQQPREILQWRQCLVDYLQEPEQGRTIEIVTAGEIEERNYQTLVQESRTLNLPTSGELCLEFLMPLPFNRKKGKSRTFISTRDFIHLYEKRFTTLFAREFTYESRQDDFSLLPYYWNYTEIRHPSKSQPGNIQLINGMVGNLYIKGTWPDFFPFLLLGSELHTGTRRANSQGYYRILPDAPSYFAHRFPDPMDLIPVTRDVIERYDEALEWLSQKEMYPFNEKAFAAELCEDLGKGKYCPSPNTAFIIEQKNKKQRLVEQLNFKDLIVSQYLLKTIYKTIDNCLEEESFGFRKQFSREKAAGRIRDSVEAGYEYVLESDIEDFFPSVDLGHLNELLDFYLPGKDTLIKDLLKQMISTGYILEGIFYERLKGLPLGNPLSPCLANLYLDDFDEQVKALEVRLVRYGDDFIILCKSPGQAEQILQKSQTFLSAVGLKIKAEKTAIRSVKDGFQFLGMTFGKDLAPGLQGPQEKSFKKPLYITEPYVFLGLSGDSVVIKKEQKIIDTFPLRRISEVMVLEKTVFSTGFIRQCVEKDIPFTITLNNGYYITTIKPDSKKYYEISHAHARKYYALSDTGCLCIAKEFAAGKIRNYSDFFKQRYKKGENEFLKELDEGISRIYQTGDIYQVRGFEGAFSKKIFSRLNDHIKYPYFHLEKRMRHRQDPINSLLNFGYYLLFSRINAAVRAVGLNPYLGFLHSPGNRYESLVCDIQELFRSGIDRLVLRLINMKIITDKDFVETNHGFFLGKEGKSKYINRMEEEMNRKEAKVSLSLKEHIYTQVVVIKNWVLENKSITFYKYNE